MLKRYRCKILRLGASQIFAILLVLSSMAAGAQPAVDVVPDDQQSGQWWREQAVVYAKQVVAADAQSEILGHLVRVQARAKELDAASAFAAQIEHPLKSVYAYTFLAKQQRQQGNHAASLQSLEQARRVAVQANQKKHQNSINAHLIQAYFDAGLREQAITFVQALPYEFDARLGTREVATELAKSGSVDEALAYVQANLRPPSRDAGLTDMARACASEGHLDDAIRIAARLTNPSSINNAYRGVIEGLVKADRIDEAKNLVERITDERTRSEAKGLIATKVAEQKSADEILAEMAPSASREEKLAVYKVLVKKLIEAGRFVDAESAIESAIKILDESPRPAVSSAFGKFDDNVQRTTIKAQYLAVALAMNRAGNREYALRRVALVEPTIVRLPDDAGLGKGFLLVELIITQAELGDLAAAKRVVESLHKSPWQCSAAAQLALAHIKANDVRSAIAIVGQTTSWVGKGHDLGRVAVGLIDAGDVPAAKELLKNLDLSKKEDDAQTYLEVGRAMIEIGRAAELKTWLSEMPTKSAAAYACLGAADELQAELNIPCLE